MGCEPDVTFTPSSNIDGPLGEAPLEETPPRVADPLPEDPRWVGPIVQFPKPPGDRIVGEDVEIPYEVIPGTSPVSEIICTVDDLDYDCALDGGVIVLPSPGQGEHQVSIEVIDDTGLSDRAEVEFEIFDRFVRQIQNVAVKDQEKVLSDILFVVDNSHSMAEEQQHIGKRILSFVDKLDGLDWRMGIITTDPTSYEDYADGRLLPFKKKQYFLHSGMDPKKVKKLFAKTIQRPEPGSPQERGIRAVFRSIERTLLPREESDQHLVDFFRKKAALSVVLLSDEDETHQDSFGDVFEDIEKSSGKHLQDLVRKKWGGNKKFQFNSIITRPGDDHCLLNLGGFAYGKHYQKLSLETGGVVGDICAEDYGSQLTTIGENVRALQTVYDLECEPQDIRRNGNPSFDVLAESGLATPGFRLDGKKVFFEKPLEPGAYKFVYFCAEAG